MPSESPEPRKANDPPSGSTNEQVSSEQAYEGYPADHNKLFGGVDPDVLLDVPVLKVDEIDLDVENVKAHVSLRAELADLVKINVGIDAYLGKVKLGIKGVEAQALLKVRLDRILGTIDRALDTIDRNPQILGGAIRSVGQALEGAGQGAERPARITEDETWQAGGAAERGDAPGQVADETEQTADSLLDETVDEAGRTVRRTVDESGNITETVLNEYGEVVGEEVTANLADLWIEEEHVDDQGQIVGRAIDESGNVVEQTLDEEGNVLDLNVPETVEDREDEDTSEVRATDAAKRKARELGVQLSSVKGTGSRGRILVKDVEKAAG